MRTLLILLLCCSTCLAQAATPAEQQAAPASTTCTYSPTPSVTVPGSASDSILKLGSYVTVHLPQQNYLKYFSLPNRAIQPEPVLYLDDQAIKGLSWTPTGCGSFSFLLTRTDESRDIWGRILTHIEPGKRIHVGIGSSQDNTFIQDVGSAELQFGGTGRLVCWGLLSILLVIAVFALGQKSGMLRDLPRPPAAGCSAIPAKQRPFSMARVQMAIWFVLATSAYVFIWLKTGDISNTIPASILTLMGISSGTTVLSAVADSSNFKNLPAECSQNFIEDILSDSDGISFHRFQMAIWTVVLAIVFIVKVSKSLCMPNFDQQLLGLMGISSATYLGFKLPALKSANTTVQPQVGPQQ